MSVRLRKKPVAAIAAAAVALGGLLLAGCAEKPAAPLAAVVAPVPATEVDGIYRGTSTRYQADARACPSPGLVLLRVVNGLFQYRWNGRIEIDGTITPDGTVQGALGEITLHGHLVSDRIEGDVQSPSCAYHFRVVKRNH